MYEIEVRNTLSSWSTRGKRFLPGVFLTDDEQIVADAMQLPQHIGIRKIEAPDIQLTSKVLEVERFSDAPPGIGMLTVQDIYKNPELFVCAHEGCGDAFSTQQALESHTTRKHPSQPVSAPVVEPVEQVVEQDEYADVIFEDLYGDSEEKQEE